MTTIEVNKTSSFTLETTSSMNLAPGQNTITFSIDNNGNFEDTFTVSASSLNGWFVTCPAVTVAYDSSSDCDINVDVPHVAAGIQDSWTGVQLPVMMHLLLTKKQEQLQLTQ